MTAALIIAAGTTPGANGFDPLKPVGGMPPVQRLVLVFQQAGIARVVLVAGPNNEALKKQAAKLGVVCLENPRLDSEMLDSVKIGLDYLQDKCDKVQITPVDIPLFSVETAKRLDASDEAVVLPIHNQATGHPIQIKAKLFGKILAYGGAGGLAGAVEASGVSRCFLEVPDAGILVDVEKESDYDALVDQHSLNALLPVVRVFVTRGGDGYGPGQQQLLRLLDDTQSLRLACQQMGVSYSKGWKMINNIEKLFGQDLVVRQQGGRHGGGSETTAKGKELIARYDAFVNDVREQTETIFDKYFKDGDL
ncbi:MAG: NTP transferase domain-containing protein [Ruminococcaceae bacterium]|nr:NTP transferase domain-containing protein [Oscillospiraceae bacterium]